MRYPLVLLLVAATAFAQSGSAVRQKVDAYRKAHEVEIVRSFADLLAMPNLASDSANIRHNAEQISSMLQARGVKTRLLEEEGGPPIVFGELAAPGARHTLIFYAHYDGQHVDKSQWAADPWQPTLRAGKVEDGAQEVPLESLSAPINPEWRIYARSAGDDKTPIQALLTALDAMKASGIPVGINVKFFFEGEEEAGSPHLPAAIQKYAELLKGDAWLICDGPVHQTRRMLVDFGARGVVDFELTLYGPSHALHSGHYGNWAPNPAVMMAHLIAAMRDTNAHILIPHFYDDVQPLTASEKQAIREMPPVEELMKNELGLSWTESPGMLLAEAISQPALNVRGIEAGHVGDQAQNAVSPEARASFDIRLVPREKPERVQELVEGFIRAQGYTIVRETPTLEQRRQAKIAKVVWGPGYPAARTDMDLPVSRAIVSTIEETLGGPIVKMPMLGGSVPMYLFNDNLHTPAVGVPIANHDDNQHAQNENLRIRNLWDGIDVMAGLLADAEKNWK
ncbi:MAG TPA: M20/M25/M40 family metallo-hydrolase [Terriglobales bacterium]|nr:M20/M25/M40 family metallo-hydrolase [Terriglobales bacterium]